MGGFTGQVASGLFAGCVASFVATPTDVSSNNIFFFVLNPMSLFRFLKK